MKKIIILALVALLLQLTACGTMDEIQIQKIPHWTVGAQAGDGSENTGDAESTAGETQGVQLQSLLTEAEMLELASCYEAENRFYESRAILEDCLRLYQSEASYLRLQGVTVNVLEENAAVQNLVCLVLQYMQAGNLEREVIPELMSQEWYETVMPKQYQGFRNYYLEKGEDILYLTLGYEQGEEPIPLSASYDESAGRFTRLWYVNKGQTLQYLEVSEDRIRSLKTGLSEGAFQGDFESLVCDALYGDIYVEQGSFHQNLLQGDYRVGCYLGKQRTDLFSLWSNWQDFELTEYYGNFENGITTLDQSEAENLTAATESSAEAAAGAFCIYAFDQKKKAYLYLEDSQDKLFDASFLGWREIPEVKKYDPVTTVTIPGGEGGEGGTTGGDGADGETGYNLFRPRKVDGIGEVKKPSTTKPGTGSSAGSTTKPSTGSSAGSTTKPSTGSSAGSTTKPGAGSSAGSTTKPSTGSSAGSTTKPGTGSSAGSTTPSTPSTPSTPTTPSTPSTPSEPTPSEPTPSEPTPSEPPAPSEPPTPSEPTPSEPPTPPPTESGTGDTDISYGDWTDPLL